MKSLKHLRCTKEMNFKEQFKTKWNESYRKSIGYYEPIFNLAKLFK